MANLAQIKTQLGVNSLEFNFLKDEAGNRLIDEKTTQPTKWTKHWDNENRQSILMHQDTYDAIVANKTMSNLGLKTTQETGPQGAYTKHIIVAYTESDLKAI